LLALAGLPVGVFLYPGQAVATIADWRVNEVLPADGAGLGIRYIELFVPPGTSGNCLFPTSRIEIFDAQGMLLGEATPFVSTVCYAGGTFFLLASAQAADHFGVSRDAPLEIDIPAGAGQVCFASSQTRYDCARWGTIATAERYLRDLDDGSSGPAIPDGLALARIGDTGVVSADFVVESPTPGRTNDGTVIDVPDAGPMADAGPPIPDAPPPDARSFIRIDARPGDAGPDANLNPRFLSADPGGGGCSCRVGASGRGGFVSPLALLLLAAWRRRARPRGGDRASGRAACQSPR